MNMKMLVPAALAIVLFATGCSAIPNRGKAVDGPNVDNVAEIQPSSMIVPTLSEIKAAKISLNIPNPNGSTILTPTAPHDRAALQRVLGWLRTAKEVGEEDPHQPMPSEGPTTLIMQLTNGMQVLVQPARNCTSLGNSTVCKFAQGYIDFQYADSNQKLRFRSPELDSWLLGK